MTWKTPTEAGGERVLSPPEARLFCNCLSTMIQMDEDSGRGLNFGYKLVIGPFHRLTDPQKYTVLEEVTKALVTPTTSIPVQTALNESAIYYVFSWLEQEFKQDLETGEDVWGELVLEALADDIIRAEGEEGGDFYPTMGCRDIEKWDHAIECLADKILWDRDWEMEAMFINAAPEIYHIANIIPEYFAPYVGKAKRGARDRLYQFITPYCT